MRNTICPRLVMAVIAVFLGANTPLDAAAPAAPPPTIWNFLGIPQTLNKARDSTSNRRGNHPGAERKDPIKRIADPANLQSENPAIKTAAKIKADQDQAPQKIKALKFLATVGCGCYPGVKEALLASMDDCTEEVRYEAAVAFCQVAGDPCKNCEKTCCNAEVMQKLHEKAFGQDEKCCYKEPSARVRAAAELALNACRRKVGPTTPAPLQPIPEKETPKETPIDEPSATPKVEPMPAPASPAPGGSAESPIESQPTAMLHIIPPPPYEGYGNQVVIQATALTQSVEPEQGDTAP